jgi:hypothetical protein
MSRDMYLTAHDVAAQPKPDLPPDVAGRVEREKQQPLRIVARSKSRGQASAQARQQENPHDGARRSARSTKSKSKSKSSV